MQERTGLPFTEIAKRVEALIVTKGRDGSLIYTNGGILEIPAAKPHRVLDPTGCGDAYRAGLIFGLLEELDWEITGRIASLMGAIKIETHGTQNHSFSMSAFRDRFRDNFHMDF